MDTPQSRANDFLLNYGRLLERLLFAQLFAGAGVEPVLAALRAYQNADGGFGNGLEPDKRSPESQPVDVEFALRVLDMLDVFPEEIVTPACDFLVSISTPAGGVPFALPSVKRYPRAPWWDVVDDPPASLNPTASIAGLLMKHNITHPWVAEAGAFCWQAIETYTGDAFHDLLPIVMFLEQAQHGDRRDHELQRVRERLLQPGVVALSLGAPGYVKFPLDWAPRANSALRSVFDDERIELDLDRLASSQQSDGGWPINWTAITPAVEYEWRGWKTVDALATLRAYGR